MTFDDLLSEVKKIKREETRAQSEELCEVVIATDHLGALISAVERYFGSPFKPQAEDPSKDAEAYSAPYGGVRAGQTLYVHKNGKAVELVLLWPWGSGTSVTVKIIRA